MGSGANHAEIAAVKDEYESNCTADADIFFAYHILNRYNKAAFLAMLRGLVQSDSGLEPFADKVGLFYENDAANFFAKKMENPKVYTLNNLSEEQKRLLVDGADE